MNIEIDTRDKEEKMNEREIDAAKRTLATLVYTLNAKYIKLLSKKVKLPHKYYTIIYIIPLYFLFFKTEK